MVGENLECCIVTGIAGTVLLLVSRRGEFIVEWLLGGASAKSASGPCRTGLELSCHGQMARAPRPPSLLCLQCGGCRYCVYRGAWLSLFVFTIVCVSSIL